MTQYYEDFGSPYTTGGAIASDTSGAWAFQLDGGGITYTIESFAGATASQVLQTNYVSGVAPTHIVVFETPGAQTGSLEVVSRLQWGESFATGNLNGFLGPQLFTATNLGFGLRRSAANTIRLTRWSLTGAAANIGAALTFTDVAADTYFWVRLGRLAGSPDTIRAKIWLDGDTEPSAWQISGTDATFVGLGMKAGVGNITGASVQLVDPISYDVIGVGTGTDSAPVADPGGGNTAPTFDGSISNLTGTEGAAITPVDVSGEFSDADSDPLTFSQVGTWPARSGGGSWVSDAGVISGTPASGSAETYTGLIVRASDGTDTVDSDAFSFTVSAAGAGAPTLDASTFPIRHGSSATFTGTNLTGATVTLDYDSVSEAQTVATTATSITIAAVVSDTLPYGTITVTATTGDGTATLGVTHQPPVGRDYAVVDVPWAAESESIFEGGVAVADGDQVDFETASQLAVTTLVRSDGTVRVESATGLHLFDVRIWDESALEWGASTPISVRPAGYEPGSPTFIGPNIADAEIEVGDTYSLSVAALFQDTDGDIVSYALGGPWPTWFTFDTATGSGTGTAGEGSYTGLYVTATDSTGNTGTSNVFGIEVAGDYVDVDAIRFANRGGRRVVNSNTGLELRARFFQHDGSVARPSSAHWKLIDGNNDTVADWTEATIVTVVDEFGAYADVYADIEIAGTYNTLASGQDSATFGVVVVADKDESNEYSDVWHYTVRAAKWR